MKKSILVVMAGLMAQAALAGGTVIHGYPAASLDGALVTVDSLCIEGDQVRTLVPHTRCVEFSADEASICLRSESKFRSGPVVSSQLRCEKYETVGEDSVCVRMARVPYSFAQTYVVPVYEVQDIGEGVYTQVGSFDYRIPACGKKF